MFGFCATLALKKLKYSGDKIIKWIKAENHHTEDAETTKFVISALKINFNDWIYGSSK